jgi:hypothetical protein
MIIKRSRPPARGRAIGLKKNKKKMILVPSILLANTLSFTSVVIDVKARNQLRSSMLRR